MLSLPETGSRVLIQSQVQNGRNIASWPVPPNSTFLCRPYSERIHIAENSFLRKSWCAIQRRGQISIECYTQEKKGAGTTASTKSHALQTQVSVLKVVPTHSVERNVVVVQEDGTLTGLSVDGTGLLFRESLFDSTTSAKVLAIECLTVQDAQSSFLKARPDLISTLTDKSVVIIGAYEQTHSRDLHVAIWRLIPKPEQISKNRTLELIISHNIGHQLPQSSAKKIQIEFDLSGKIEINSVSSTLTFDLTKAIPQKTPERKHLVMDHLSNLELAKNIRLYLTSNKLQLCNTAFRSVLATSEIGSSFLKRKHGAEGGKYLSLLEYFSKMRRVLAYNGTELLAIDIHSSTTQDPFRRSSLLIGNILRGAEKQDRRTKVLHEQTHAIGKAPREKTFQSWSLISQELDALAEKNDSVAFEDLFMKTFDVQRPKDLNASKVPNSKVNFLLAKLFTLDSDEDNHLHKPLKLSLRSMELLKGCICNGFVDEHRIGQALNSSASVTNNAVVQSLLDAAPDLELIQVYIQDSPFLQPSTLILLIEILVSRALNQSNEDALARLDDEEKKIDVDVASQQVTTVSRPDELNTNSPTTTCLAHALQRLAFTGPSIVSAQFRRLDQKMILALIQFLRQQLFLGGYSRLGDNQRQPSSPASKVLEEGYNSNPNPQITLSSIITLLNGCIDAIGVVGILGLGEHEDFIQKMVPELLSEISSTSRAVEDAVFLQGLVRETLRYVESVEKQPFEVRTRVENRTMEAASQKGQIVTLYAETDTGEAGGLPESRLPLSLKAAEDIDKFKVRKGGQAHPRSAREIGMLRDRLRAAYSFERLVL